MRNAASADAAKESPTSDQPAKSPKKRRRRRPKGLTGSPKLVSSGFGWTFSGIGDYLVSKRSLA